MNIYIYIYTRRKDGAKAPSLLDHLDVRSPTFDADAQDLRYPMMLKPCIFEVRPSMLKPWIFEIRSSAAKALDLRTPTFNAKAFDLRLPISGLRLPQILDPRPPTSQNSRLGTSDFPKFPTLGLRLP